MKTNPLQTLILACALLIQAPMAIADDPGGLDHKAIGESRMPQLPDNLLHHTAVLFFALLG